MVSSSFPIFLGLGYSFSGIVALTLPKYSKPFIVSSILLPYTAVIIYKYAKRWFWQQNTFNQWIIPTPLEALDYILTNSERNCQKVLKSFDKFCWDKPMMNLGDVKGKIVDLSVNSALASVQGPRFNMLELGLMKAHEGNLEKMIFSVDPDPLATAVQAKLLWHAKVTEYVTPVYAKSSDAIHQFLTDKLKFDCIFLDHVKDLYLPDLKKMLEYGLLNPNCVVIADNVLYPGVPGYKEFMLTGDGKELFETVVHDTLVAYSTSKKDQILISVYKGT